VFHPHSSPKGKREPISMFIMIIMGTHLFWFLQNCLIFSQVKIAGARHESLPLGAAAGTLQLLLYWNSFMCTFLWCLANSHNWSWFPKPTPCEGCANLSLRSIHPQLCWTLKQGKQPTRGMYRVMRGIHRSKRGIYRSVLGFSTQYRVAISATSSVSNSLSFRALWGYMD
jgi:hypothetical protein